MTDFSSPEAGPSSQEAFFAQALKAQSPLRAVIVAMVRDFNVADDLLQETMLEIFRSQQKFDPKLDFQRWAKGIARHVVLRYYSSKSRLPAAVDPETLSFLADVMIEEEDQDGRWEREKKRLRFCLERLTERNRRLFMLRYEQDLKGPSLADRCGLNLKSIRTTLLRIRLFLRKCIDSQAGWTARASEEVL